MHKPLGTPATDPFRKQRKASCACSQQASIFTIFQRTSSQYSSSSSNAEVSMLSLTIRALLVALALAVLAVAPSSAREDYKCYDSCKARCTARYACEGRHPGPNCFTNFNKCRTSCWRMCRLL